MEGPAYHRDKEGGFPEASNLLLPDLSSQSLVNSRHLCEPDLVGKNKQVPRALLRHQSLPFSVTASSARATLPLPLWSAGSHKTHAPGDRDTGLISLDIIIIIILFLHCQHLFLSFCPQLYSRNTALLEVILIESTALDAVIPGNDWYLSDPLCPSFQATWETSIPVSKQCSFWALSKTS